MTETPLRILLDGSPLLEATLGDSPAARDLIDQLPLTLEFSDYGGQEVLATPPRALTMEGMPAGQSAPEGAIGWYAPAGVVVLYYADVPRFPGIVRLGEIHGDVSALRGWDSTRALRLERAR